MGLLQYLASPFSIQGLLAASLVLGNVHDSSFFPLPMHTRTLDSLDINEVAVLGTLP